MSEPRPSSSSTNTRQQEIQIQNEDEPERPVKIPPPPTEQPPPYTPYTPFLRNRREVNFVRPKGIGRYLQHLTPLNLLIAFIIIIGLCVFVYVVHKSNVSDEDRLEPLEGAHKALEIKNRPLGEFKNSRERISWDEANNLVILSDYDPETGVLNAETKNVDDHLSLFEQFTKKIPGKYSDCMRFTKDVYCCSTSIQSRHHKTDCYLRDFENSGREIHTVAVMYDFLQHGWQSLDDEEKLLIVHNRQRHAVLDLKNQKIYVIEENRLPHGYYSVAFFFPQNTVNELDELVRKENEFRICGYKKSTEDTYKLTERRCQHTPFTVDFELPKVRFCTNPLYSAVVQYGHLNGESDVLTWRLRVKFDSAPELFSATESLESRLEQITIDCNDNEVVIFAMGIYELHEYSVKLPKLRSEHFVQTR